LIAHVDFNGCGNIPFGLLGRRTNVLEQPADLSRYVICFNRCGNGSAVGMPQYVKNLGLQDKRSELKATDVFTGGDVASDPNTKRSPNP